jgi:hypothetical protein
MGYEPFPMRNLHQLEPQPVTLALLHMLLVSPLK